MNIVRTILIAAAASLAASAAQAYCFENKSDKWLHVDEVKTTEGKLLKFYGDILPGQSSCCDWKDAECNPDGDVNSALNFSIYALPDKSGASPGGWTFTLQAGGRIVLENTNDAMNPLKCSLFEPGI